jgi:hypothetical protein
MPAYSLKLPLVVDLSEGDQGAPFDQANPKPVAVLARACVAYFPSYDQTYLCSSVGPDTSSAALWQSAKQNGIKFGVYAYILQNQIDWQAQTFINYCKQAGFLTNGNWLLDFPPVADVEVEIPAIPLRPPVGYVAPVMFEAWAAQVKQWLDLVENALGIKPWIYTAQPQWKWLLSNNGMGDAPSWTPQYKFWIKWYPYSDYVDANQSLPNSCLPTGMTQDLVVLWQYAEDGESQNYQYSDLNLPVNAGLQIFTGSNPNPIPIPNPIPNPPAVFDPTKPDTISTSLPFVGIPVSIEDRNYASPRQIVVHLIKIPLTMHGLKFMVMPHMNPGSVVPVNAMTVIDFLKTYRPMKIAINGDQFQPMVASGQHTRPFGTTASQGDIYVKNNNEDTLYINANNTFSLTKPATVYNAISYNHTLVVSGNAVQGLDEGQIAPRTGIGWTDGLAYLILADGVEGQSGLTLAEFAQFMGSLNVQFAVNMDGGGSTSGAMHFPDGTFHLINSPSDNNVPGTLRPLGSILGVTW